MGNPFCPNCGNMLRLKWLHVKKSMPNEIGGYSRFWVCEQCRNAMLRGLRDVKWKWKAGSEVIR